MSGVLRACCMAGLAAITSAVAVPASAQTFPFDREMLLEVKPLPGSRRVPILEVRSDGRASVDMWCHRAEAQVTVEGSEFKLNFVAATPENCTPERIELDQTLAKAMSELTSWRMREDIIELIGSTNFRFRLSTH